jgi:hypothetical protein
MPSLLAAAAGPGFAATALAWFAPHFGQKVDAPIS